MKKELYFEKLERIYDQFLNTTIISSFNEFFKIICNEFEFLAPIKSKSQEELNENNILYRGVGNNRKHMVNLVCETNPENIFIGDGVYGNGIYCTKNFTTALTEYACKNKKNVIKMYLDDCNMVEHWRIDTLQKFIKHKFRMPCNFPLYDEDIETVNSLTNSNEKLKWLFEFLESKKHTHERDSFLQKLLPYENESNLAAIIGYDALNIASKYKPLQNETYLILNRGKLSIEKRFHKMLNRKHKRSSPSKQKLTTEQAEPQPN